jgi:hypothetical protein
MIARNGTLWTATPAAIARSADLGGGVEAEPEENPEWVHLPALVDLVADAAEEEAAHEALVKKRLFELLLVVVAALHSLEDAEDVEQDDKVEDADDDQEGARHRRANVAAVVLCLSGLRWRPGRVAFAARPAWTAELVCRANSCAGFLPLAIRVLVRVRWRSALHFPCQ